MPPDILDEQQDLGARRAGDARERAAVHRARLLVDGFVPAHLLDEVEQLRIREAHVPAQLDAFDLLHQVAEHRALAAAARHGALLHARAQPFDALAGRHGDRVRLPIDLHRGDRLDRRHQALVAQVAQRKRLGRVPERHEGDNLALVEVEGERMLAGDRRRHHLAALVVGLDFEGRRLGGVGEFGAVLLEHGFITR